MKKKFILLAMMLLTLIGGVNLNVLNAQQQETIEIGEGSTSTSYSIPSYTYYGNRSFTQQIYTAGEINAASGNVISISFKKQRGNNNVRNISVYMENTDKTSFTGNQYEWIFLNSEPVYEGTFDWSTGEGWVTISLSTPFEYNGDGILLSVYDNTGVAYPYTNYDKFYTYSSTDYKAMYVSNTASMPSTDNPYVQGTALKSNNQIRLTFEPASDIIPADPTNLAVVECTHNSVSLTWDAAENADKYNVHVYNNGVEITGSPFASTETAYTVKGLDAETTYTFKVRSVCGSNLSENFSNEVSATTLEYNDPLVGKQFRLRALTYIEKEEYYSWGNTYTYYYGPYDFSEAKYLHIENNNAAGLKVIDKEDRNAQRFTFEPTGNVEGQYYLRSADGYYINCGSWDVSAYDESQKSPIEVVYLDDTQTQFYLTNGTGRHFKVETAYGDGVNFKPFCDAAQQYAAKWIVEEVEFQAIATVTDEEIYDDQTTTLSVTAFDGSGYTYSWSPSECLDDATSANPTFTPTATGEHTFTCTVIDTESNATTEASVKVYVNARPDLELAVSADKELIYNDGETAVLTATVTEGTGYAPYTYSWTLNETEDGTEATYAFSSETVGVYNLTCTVTDARNNIQTASTTIEVKDESEKPLEIVLGTDNTGNAASADGYIPTNTFYYYSLTQQIYTKNEIGMDGNIIINSIAFKESAGQTTTRNLSIYIQNTSETAVNSLYSMNKNDLRFAGNVEFRPYEWTVVTLDTPFEYDASKNILLCVDDNTGSYVSGRSFATYYNGEGGSYYAYSDNTNFDPMDPSNGNGSSGSKNHIKLGYEIPAPKPENLVATPAQIHVGETTTLTWNELEGAARYNIYVNGELKYNTAETSYELSGLTYNVEPGHTIEVAAVYEDETESGKASVTVQVAGTFTLTVNVTDGTNPIKGATVNIDMAYAYDEFKNQISPVTVEPTGDDGKTTVELSRLPNEGFYDDNGNWVYPFYTVEVLKSPYQKQEKYINPGDVVTNSHTMDFVLALPTVSNIQVQDEEGENLYGDVMEGTNVVLSWDEVEGADAYKVSKLVDGEVESFETVTETTYTIKGVSKGYQYAVSALFGDLESEKYYANLTVKGNGYFKGYVTYGTNALEGIQVKVSSEYGDVSAVATTNEDGYFIGEIMEGENYKLTISHSDYEEYILENITIIYNTASELGTIQLTAKPSASGITEVTATLNGENVVVNWTVDEAYTKYNVYRRLAGTQGKGDNIAQDVAVTSYTDAQWETLEPGTYQYGVSAFVEPQAQKRGTEVIFEEGFETTETNEVPEGWYKISGNWRVTNYSNSGGVLSGSQHLWTQYMQSGDHYLVMPAIAPAGATLSFVYRSAPFSGTYDDLTICYSTSQDGPWTKINDEVYRETSKTQVSIPLDNIEASTVYIAFCMTARYADGIYIDDVVVTREKASLVETQIVWSNEVVKQGPNTFIGGDTENPTAWNVDANWSHGNAPEAGDEVIVNAEAVISGNVELSALDIVGNGSVTVDANASLTVTGAITQEQDYSLIMNDGAQVFQNNANVKAQFNMNLVNPSDWLTSNKDGWQFISSPLSNVNVTNIAEGNYDLYKYDGDAKSGLEWLNHKDENFADATYQHHIGYLASHETKTTLEFKGTLNTKDAYGFYEYIDYYENEEDLLKNFHLIGNPYPYNITWADFKNSVGIYNGYAYVKSDGNYEYATSGTIAPGDGFFVKATGVGEYGTYYYYLEGSGNTRSTRESNNSLNITATGNAGEDNVIINLAGKSEGFDKLQNFNDAIATVYVAEDGKNYGIYNCDADVQEVELSFNANQMGNYTISIEPNGKFQTVTLVDRFTGVETNMLVEDYNFTAMSGVNNNRFIVKLAVSDQQSAVSDNFVYQSGEDLIIDAEGTVQIIDVMGRVLLSDEVESTNNRINVSGFQNGTYMVRVINGSEVKVEKVVIY